MILYRKAAQLRVRRASAPEAPFWAATTIAPYGAKRATPVAIDYLALRATGAEKVEVTVTEDVRDELERTRAFAGPVLIESAEAAEVVFRRGEDALRFCEERELAAMQLISTLGPLPSPRPRGEGQGEGSLIISAWPLDHPRLDILFAAASPLSWGVAVPVLYPLTTDLAPLEQLADAAQKHGASFLAAIGIDLEPTAKQALAQSMNLSVEDDRYAMLFHSALEPVHLATERHIAALAAERGLADFVVPPEWGERTNWNAAVLLARTASRMIAMELDLDLAGLIARSARAIAELDKPLTRVAESASLSILGGLDETSAELLTEWLESGAAPFAEYVDEQWRSRRA